MGLDLGLTKKTLINGRHGLGGETSAVGKRLFTC